MRKRTEGWTRREEDLLSRLEAANAEAGKFKERQRRDAYERRKAEKKLSARLTVHTHIG